MIRYRKALKDSIAAHYLLPWDNGAGSAQAVYSGSEVRCTKNALQRPGRARPGREE